MASLQRSAAFGAFTAASLACALAAAARDDPPLADGEGLELAVKATYLCEIAGLLDG